MQRILIINTLRRFTEDTQVSHIFFTIGTTLTIDDPLRFKKNLLDSL